MKNLKSETQENFSSFEQIDITQSYLKAFDSVIGSDQNNLSPNLKEKIYPAGVKKITYSPQTEAVYYFESEKANHSLIKNTWELFEDRGAVVESRLIECLSEVESIKQDYEIINKEEAQIEEMKTDELIATIIDYVNNYGEKAFRYRMDKGTKEKCMIFSFHRTMMTEEIIVFGSDSYLVINREEKEDMIHQRVMKYMNKTVLGWYYEGLLRTKRLETKQKKYIQKSSRYTNI